MYSDKDIQRLYDKKYFSSRKKPSLWERRAEYLVEKFQPKKVLDIGSSWGDFVKALNDKHVDAYGIEGADYAISQVDPSIKNKIFKVNFNSDRFPFEDNTFDIITGFYVVEHIHNIKFFASELLRVLKDDGFIWFLTPNEDESGRNQYDVFTNKFENWKKIFEKENLDVKKFSPHEMLVLKGKLKKFHFYKLPISLQNIIKRIAYDYANYKSMKDTSFTLQKN